MSFLSNMYEIGNIMLLIETLFPIKNVSFKMSNSICYAYKLVLENNDLTKKANLRDLKAATGLVILLKWDSICFIFHLA